MADAPTEEAGSEKTVLRDGQGNRSPFLDQRDVAALLRAPDPAAFLENLDGIRSWAVAWELGRYQAGTSTSIASIFSGRP